MVIYDPRFTDLCNSDTGRLLGVTPYALLWVTVMKRRKRLY